MFPNVFTNIVELLHTVCYFDFNIMNFIKYKDYFGVRRGLPKRTG